METVILCTFAFYIGEVLLPIREAYEWKPSEVDHIPWINLPLLPIREAYEWK